jgi:cytidylate kinase
MKDYINRVNKKIKLLNTHGIPFVFIVTGNNSSGKTVISKKLFQNLNFYHHINLGIVSKMIRYFRPDLESDKLENFSKESNKTFTELIDLIIDHYFNVGVNIIIEGVQFNTAQCLVDNRITGGIILDIPKPLSVERGLFPETHFLRKIRLKDMSELEYESNEKFKKINNEQTVDRTLELTYKHIDSLLDQILDKHSIQLPYSLSHKKTNVYSWIREYLF